MKYPPQRLAKIRLGLEEVHTMLGIPPGLRIEGIYTTHDPTAINVLVSGPDLEELPPGCEAPYLQGHGIAKVVEVDGDHYRRYEWQEARR